MRTIGELKAKRPGFVSCVAVLGYHTPGDGGGGKFFWDDSAVGQDDHGTCLVSNTNPPAGRWKRVALGPLSVKWFGAKGDGVSDDDFSQQDTRRRRFG